jgi:ParB family chromosome partitioning protein
MAKELKLNLPSADDLFSTQEERDDAKREKVVNIPRSEIDSFSDHPFQVKMDDSMTALVESVKAVGVQTPAVVRPKEDGRYEYVAGHRRDMACELAGLDTMPCIIREMSRDQAIIAMVDSNLQREQILPSEKAKSYKMRLEAMNRQGKRTDLTYSPVANKLPGKTSSAELAEQLGTSKDQIFRYVRLNELTPELLNMVDDGKIAMRPAVELSYLSKEHQQALHGAIESEDCTPSHVQAMKMRKFADEGRLNGDVILSIMQEEKPNQAEQFKMPQERISKFFKPGTPHEKIQDTIIKALDYYQRHLERQRGDAR